MQTTPRQPIASPEGNYFFNISPLESIHGRHDSRMKPIQLPYYQIVWISRGSGFFKIDLEKYRIEDEKVYTIPSCRIHQVLPDDRLSGYVLSFNLDFLCLTIDRP